MLINSLQKLWTKTLELKEWFAEQDRQLMNPTPSPNVNSVTTVNPPPTVTTGSGAAGGSTYTTGTIAINSSAYSFSGLTGYASGGGGYTSGLSNGIFSSGFTTSLPPEYLVAFFDTSGSEILRVEPDGTVIWKGGISADTLTDAQNALSRSINLSLEAKVGITEGTKRRIRDQVFDEIIGFAKERGALTADDLTFMLESSKIIEKLKGV